MSPLLKTSLLIIVATFCQSLMAVPHCDSDIVLQHHEVCESAKNAVVFKEARSSNCEVEKYKTCSFSHSYVFSGIFYGSMTAVDPSDELIIQKCESLRGGVWGLLRTSITTKWRWDENENTRDENWEQAINEGLGGLPYPNDTNRGLFDGLSKIGLRYTTKEKVHFLVNQNPTSIEITEFDIKDGINPRRSDDWNITCGYQAEFDIKLSQTDEACGAESFKSCRHERHGFEKYASQEASDCPVKRDQYSIMPFSEFRASEEKLSRRFTPVCPTLNNVSEKSELEQRKKLRQLEENLRLLRTGTNFLIETNILNLPKEALKLNFSLTPSEVKLRLQVLLEIYRLRIELKENKEQLAAIKSDIVEMAKHLRLSYPSPDSDLEGLFKIFSKAGAANTLAVLPLVFPEEAVRWSNKARHQFYKVDTALYAMLFPGGVTLSDDELLRARDFIETSDDSLASYRMAEAAVLTAFKKVRAMEEKGMQTRDLQLLILRDGTDFSKIPGLLSKIFNESQDDVQNKFKAYQSNREALKRELVKILNFKIAVLNRSIEFTYKELFAVIDLTQKLPKPDSRVRLLEGYKALALLDAPKLRSVFRDTRISIQNTNEKETSNSIQILAKFTGEALKTLVSLQKMLHSTADQRVGLEQSVMARINMLTESAQGLDRVRFINDEIWRSLDGDFMQETLLVERLNQLIKEEYGAFIAILQTLPEFGRQGQ